MLWSIIYDIWYTSYVYDSWSPKVLQKLVGGFNPSVSWEYSSQYMEKKNHVPNHQPGNGGRTRNRFFIIGPPLATTTTTGGIFTEDL